MYVWNVLEPLKTRYLALHAIAEGRDVGEALESGPLDGQIPPNRQALQSKPRGP